MAPSNLLLFSLLILLVMLTQKVRSQTSFNIDAFTPHSLLLTYERIAFVPPDTTYVRLAPGPTNYGDRVGRVLFSAPVKLWEQTKQASFQTTITFQIKRLNDYLYGMTFFMSFPGSAIFAVEFHNDKDLSTDLPYKHIGININSKTSQNTTSFEDATGKLVTARITYDVPTKKISVVATYGSSNATVSFAYNLKALLPQQVQVGLSASSYLNGGKYDVFTWHFSSTMVSDVNTVVDDNTYIQKYVT
ncbi:hypothetical protein ACS0TY_009081 [Phlomoides rotata]